MRNMSEEIDRLIESLGGRAPALGLTHQRGARGSAEAGGFWPAAWAPQIETVQKPNALVLRVDLPGLTSEDVTVNVDDGLLTISGERKQEHEEKSDGVLRTERSYGTFFRAMPLPDGAEEDKIAAAFKNGVLEITVPLSSRERGRRIKVEA
jgi:HSP20 family protein